MPAIPNTSAFHQRWAHPLWLRVAVRGTGLLFLLSGLAKVPVLGALAQTIGELTHTSGIFPLASAGVVVAAEAAGGTALLLGRVVRPAAGGLMLLTGVFLFFLYQAVTGAHPFICNCFGVLGIRLSNRAELLLDLVLFNLLMAILAFWPSGRMRWRFAGRAILLMLAALGIAGSEGYLLLRGPQGAEAHESFRLPLAYVRAHLPGGVSLTGGAGTSRAESGRPGTGRPGAGKPAMMFLLRFEDFTCPLCFQDFLDLADSLASRRTPALEGRVWALMRAGGAERLEGNGRLARWAEETGLSFPIMTVPDSIFDAAGVRKSMVAVLTDAERPLFRGEFPMGAERRLEALRLLGGTGGTGEE